MLFICFPSGILVAPRHRLPSWPVPEKALDTESLMSSLFGSTSQVSSQFVAGRVKCMWCGSAGRGLWMFACGFLWTWLCAHFSVVDRAWCHFLNSLTALSAPIHRPGSSIKSPNLKVVWGTLNTQNSQYIKYTQEIDVFITVTLFI